MRALGEMAVHNPVAGSFGQYASLYWGRWRAYPRLDLRVEMVIVGMADVTACRYYMGFWFPEVARWIWVLGIVSVVGGRNLCNVKVFGEMEFWLSLLKVGRHRRDDRGRLRHHVVRHQHRRPAPGDRHQHSGSHGGFMRKAWAV